MILYGADVTVSNCAVWMLVDVGERRCYVSSLDAS